MKISQVPVIAGLCALLGFGDARSAESPPGAAALTIDGSAASPFSLIAKVKEPVAAQAANAAALTQSGLKVSKTFKRVPGLQVLEIDPAAGAGVGAAALTAETTQAKIKALMATGLFEYVEPDWQVQALQTPADTGLSDGSLWGLRNTGQSGGTAGIDVNAIPAWSLTTGSPSVVVAVIDSGVRYTHQDLAANMWVNTAEIAGNGIDDDGNGYIDDRFGINAITGSGNPMDDNKHGSHCAGTIAATANNAGRHVGVAFQSRIMALKFLGADGRGNLSDAMECIDYAVTRGAKVLSNSWGGGPYSQGMADSIRAANDAGAIFIAAAGNSSDDNDQVPHYPSSYEMPNVISVAAIDRNGNLAGFSCFGARSVDLAAPGVDILSCTAASDSSYELLDGTSMATPHVSGVAALIAARFPTVGVTEMKNRLLGFTTPLSSLTGKTVTGGMVNAYASLAAGPDGLMEIQVTSTSGAELPVGGAAGFEITLTDIQPVLGATVSARFGASTPVTFFDNGVAPDLTAGDGVYTRTMTVPATVGTVVLSVTASAPGKSPLARDFNFTTVNRPVNDAFANRIILASGSTQATGTNVAATTESGEPLNPPESGGKTVWWQWTAPSSAGVIISTSGSSFDTTLAVYQGGPTLGTLVLMGANDDSGGLQSSVSFTAVAGTSYYLQVSGYASNEGAIQLNYPAPGVPSSPPAIVSQPAGRTVPEGAPFSLTVQATGAAPLAYQWYRDGGLITGATQTTYEVLSATEAHEGSYTVLVSNPHGSRVSNPAFVSVEQVTVRPPNDNFADMEILRGTSGRVSGTNVASTGEVGEPNHDDAAEPLASIWYRWTAPSNGTLTLDTFGSDFDTVLAAYTGTSVAGLTYKASDDDSDGTYQSRISFAVNAGQAYRIVVDGYNNRQGNVVLNYQFAPAAVALPNDQFANRTTMTGSTVSVVGSNIGATGETSEPNHADASSPLASVWWKWTAPASGEVVLDTLGSEFDTTLAVYQGTSLSGLTVVGSNDDFGGELTSRVAFTATSGVTYIFAVDGYTTAQGIIALNLRLTVPVTTITQTLAANSVSTWTASGDKLQDATLLSPVGSSSDAFDGVGNITMTPALTLPTLRAPSAAGPLSSTATAGNFAVSRTVSLVAGRHATDEVIVVRNTSATAQSLTLRLRDDYGSNTSTNIHRTSSGDQTLDANDRWFISNDKAQTQPEVTSGDPTLFISWLYSQNMPVPAISLVPGVSPDDFELNFGTFNVAAGDTVIVTFRRELFDSAIDALANGDPLEAAEILVQTLPDASVSRWGNLYGFVPGPSHIEEADLEKAGVAQGDAFDGAGLVEITSSAPLTSGGSWATVPIPTKTGSFSETLYLTPSADDIDGVTGYSSGPADWWPDLAVIVRFNTDGRIDARDGGTYRAANTLNYSPGVRYRVDFTVNIDTHRFSATVTPAGGSAVVIANNYAFRTEQNTVTSLDHIGYVTWDGGSHIVEVPAFSLPLRSLVATDTSGPLRSVASAGGLTVEKTVTLLPGRHATDEIITISNTSTASRSLNLTVQDNYGSDGSTRVHYTSSGDAVVSSADRWFISSDRDSPGTRGSDPALQVSWGYSGNLPTPSFLQVPSSGGDDLALSFPGINLAAGTYARVTLRRELFATALEAQATGIPMGAPISVFNDAAYVDTAQEGTNLRASLVNLGYQVVPFTGTSTTAWSNAFAASRVVVIPETEIAALNLSVATRDVIAARLASGGRLVVIGNSDSREETLLNAVAGWGLADSSTATSGTMPKTAGIPGFADSPANLPLENPTYLVTGTSLPLGAQAVYQDGSGNVAIFQSERIAYLGHDWTHTPTPAWDAVLRDCIAGLISTSAPAPELAVEGPDGEDLLAESSMLGFGTASLVTPSSWDSWRSVQIRNDGASDLTGLTVSVVGANPGDYELFYTFADTVLTPGEEEQVQIYFYPTATGIRPATLRITSSDPLHAQVDVPLVGTGSAYLTTANARVFMDPAYVDVSGEGVHLQSALRKLGYAVETFTGTAAATWEDAFKAAPLVIIPECEVATLSLPADTITAIRTHLAKGGRLIVMGSNGTSEEDLLNTLAGSTILPNGYRLDGTMAKNPAATGFPNSPANLVMRDAVYCVASNSLPPGARAVYQDGDNRTAAFIAGHTGYLGYDFYAGTAADWEALLADMIEQTGLPAPDEIVVPAMVEGNSDLNTPLRETPRTLQYVLSASQLGNLPVGSEIRALAFRLNAVEDGPTWPPTDLNWSQYNIQLSPSLNPSGSLSTTFATNIGAGAVTVRSGALTIPADSFLLGGSAPSRFGPDITFTTPYQYTGGDLLVTIRHSGSAAGFNRYADAVADQAGVGQGQYATASNSTVAEGFGFYPVTRFRWAVSPVPEIAVETGSGVPLVDGGSTLTFATVPVGSSSSGSFTLRNVGGAALTGISRSFLGTNPGDFTLTPPLPATLAAGASFSFNLTFTAGAVGSRSAELRIASNDADENPFNLQLAGTGQPIATPPVTHSASGYRAGQQCIFHIAINYTGQSLSALGHEFQIPAGWTYVSDTSTAGAKPAAGQSGLLEWAWFTIPTDGLTFDVTLMAPAGATGAQSFTGAATLANLQGGQTRLQAQPHPLLVSPLPSIHSADTSADNRLNLSELLGVISLYNYRSGATRTGEYYRDGTSYLPGPGAQTPPYHSTDTSADWRMSLSELLGTISLYNYRAGTVRTGEYYYSTTESRFIPGPSPGGTSLLAGGKGANAGQGPTVQADMTLQASMTKTSGALQPGGGTLSLQIDLGYPSASVSALGVELQIPSGWTYASGDSSAGVKPDAGQSGTLEWAWFTIPAEPETVTVNLTYPAGATLTGITGRMIATGLDGSFHEHALALAGDPYSTWADTAFPGGGTPDRTRTGDPDHDGLSNLLEYALGLPPMTSNPSVLRIVAEPGGFRLSYDRPIGGVPGLTYTLRSATGLNATWDPITTGLQYTTLNPTTERVSVLVTGASAARFYRLEVTEPVTP